MELIQRIIAILMLLICSSCRLCWAEEARVPDWSAPVVQHVTMPAGIRAGVFYPEHDELVVIRPGAWVPLNKEDPRKGSSGPLMMEVEGLPVPVTFMGRVKLFDALKVMADVSGKVLSLGPGIEDNEVIRIYVG